MRGHIKGEQWGQLGLTRPHSARASLTANGVGPARTAVLLPEPSGRRRAPYEPYRGPQRMRSRRARGRRRRRLRIRASWPQPPTSSPSGNASVPAASSLTGARAIPASEEGVPGTYGTPATWPASRAAVVPGIPGTRTINGTPDLASTSQSQRESLSLEL
jgi:hypothetical protein